MVARNGAIVMSFMIVLALSGLLVVAFRQFTIYSLWYVAAIRATRCISSSDRLLYSGQQGSLMYWALTLSIFGAVVGYQRTSIGCDRSSASDRRADGDRDLLLPDPHFAEKPILNTPSRQRMGRG